MASIKHRVEFAYDFVVLAKQRVFYSSKSRESASFEADYSQVVEYKKKLSKTLKSTKTWFEASAKLAKNALSVVELLGNHVTPEEKTRLKALEKELKAQAKGGTLTKSLRERIKLLNGVSAARSDLLYFRLKHERAARKKRKFQAAQVQSDKSASKLKYWSDRVDKYGQAHNDQLVQLTAAMQVLREYNEKEGNGIASRDLAAIRTSLRYLFRTVLQVMSDGSDDEDDGNTGTATNIPLGKVSDAMEAAREADREDWKRVSGKISEAMDDAAAVHGVPDSQRLSQRFDALQDDDEDRHDEREQQAMYPAMTSDNEEYYNDDGDYERSDYDEEDDVEGNDDEPERSPRISTSSGLGMDLDVVPGTHTNALANALEKAQQKMRKDSE